MKTIVVNIKDCPEGWESDPRYAYVGRISASNPGDYGNPHGRICYRCNRDHDRYEAVRLHAEEARSRHVSDEAYRGSSERLRGRFLVCFCKKAEVEAPCHADVYVELLEGTRP